MGHSNLPPNWPIVASDSLQSDLRYLLANVPDAIVEVRNISRMTAPGEGRACYQVRLESGEYIKARLYASSEIRVSVEGILGTLTDLAFSRLVDSHGRGTLEEWVTGKLVSSMMPDPKQAMLAGELLGKLHAKSGWKQSTDSIERNVEWHLDQVQHNLAKLCEHGQLSTAVTTKLIADAKSLTPANSDMGIVHLDFCADNMVWTADEKLVVIDNERFKDGVLDFDLARCFMRWPLTAIQKSAFRSGYQSYRSLASFDSNNRFWMLCALAHSTWYSLQCGVANELKLKLLESLAVDSGNKSS